MLAPGRRNLPMTDLPRTSMHLPMASFRTPTQTPSRHLGPSEQCQESWQVLQLQSMGRKLKREEPARIIGPKAQPPSRDSYAEAGRRGPKKEPAPMAAMDERAQGDPACSICPSCKRTFTTD